MNKQIKAYDECLRLIDQMIARKGKSNIFFLSDINELRNSITELQEEIDKKLNGKI